MPSAADLEDTKRRIEYQDGLYHFAVAGIAGGGKSSLINALRGLRNSDVGAAATGITETTSYVGRFPDPDQTNPFVWYDIPGAGTLKVPDWEYFNKQGLYVFDALIVVVDNRFTATDVAILRNARLFNIPCYIVRSKADVMRDMPEYESDDEEQDARSREARATLECSAREHFVSATRQTQRVYIVSNSMMLSAIKGNVTTRTAKKIIDEFEFLQYVLGDAYKRRGAELEHQLREGIQPVVMPSAADLEDAKRRIQYQDGLYHFAVAGIAGGGKSSLINALRGLRNRAAGAAATGITETTLHVGRFPDSDPKNPFVWYDIPGAGTLQVRDWQYFNKQGLYVFDALVVLVDNRFTMTDVAILRNARLFGIPCYIVRSKADIHIQNVMREMTDESEDEEQDEQSRATLEHAARKHFISATRQNVRDNLRAADLPDQRVYIVSNLTMLSATKGNVTNKTAKKVIDEFEFLQDLLGDAIPKI
ncbi:interferon-inducible GTPase-domain-containing protein [Mycena sanguinolenta]|nr:interferon-inducible GTPase-domain-containing protein [Mycena sanguinolenta]